MDPQIQEIPRVPLSLIQERMRSVIYRVTYVESTNLTIVTSFLNGKFFLASGTSACIDDRLFDPAKGHEIALARCVDATENKLWELEGYQLYRSIQDIVPE